MGKYPLAAGRRPFEIVGAVYAPLYFAALSKAALPHNYATASPRSAFTNLIKMRIFADTKPPLTT